MKLYIIECCNGYHEMARIADKGDAIFASSLEHCPSYGAVVMDGSKMIASDGEEWIPDNDGPDRTDPGYWLDNY